MLSSQDVKQAAKALGADLCGVASLDRFEGAPTQMDARQIMAELNSVVAMDSRIMRGTLRAIEEDTHSLPLRSSFSWRPT